MSIKTARVTHLAEQSPLRPGDTVKQGELIGIMGSTGLSSINHTHLDAIKGVVKGCWRSGQIISGQFELDLDFMMQFIRYELLNGPLKISYFVDDPRYQEHVEKYLKQKANPHKGIDILEWSGRSVPIYWPLEVPGTCLSNYFDNSAYGWAVNICANEEQNNV